VKAAARVGISLKAVTIGQPPSDMREKSGIEFYSVNPSVLPLLTKSKMFYFNEAVSCFRAMNQARMLDCDAIHYLNVTKETASLAKKVLRVEKPCIAHLFHSEYAFKRIDFRLHLLFMRLRLFDEILTVNKSLLNYLVAKKGIERSRVDYVPIPIDTNRFRIRDTKVLREKYNIRQDAPVIVYVGAIYPDRGIFVLLEAFREVLKRIPNALLYIFHSKLSGDEEVFSPHFYRLAKHKEFAGHVVIQGPQSSIDEVYCLADVVALPFTQPYWITDPPLVLLEAMASGVPIVTTPVGAIKDVVEEGKNAILAEAGNEASLSEALSWAISNESDARKLGLRARKKIEQEFSMDIVGTKLRSVYEKIIELNN
jgi:glycosyltransferase involved in cell wall biosynthesis